MIDGPTNRQDRVSYALFPTQCAAGTFEPRGDGDQAVAQMEAAMLLLRGWVWETDEEYRFTYMSDSVVSFTGRPPEWHYGHTREELGNCVVSAEEAELARRQLAECDPFGPFEYQRRQDDLCSGCAPRACHSFPATARSSVIAASRLM